jgi:hypothetical protein
VIPKATAPRPYVPELLWELSGFPVPETTHKRIFIHSLSRTLTSYPSIRAAETTLYCPDLSWVCYIEGGKNVDQLQYQSTTVAERSKS